FEFVSLKRFAGVEPLGDLSLARIDRRDAVSTIDKQESYIRGSAWTHIRDSECDSFTEVHLNSTPVFLDVSFRILVFEFDQLEIDVYGTLYGRGFFGLYCSQFNKGLCARDPPKALFYSC